MLARRPNHRHGDRTAISGAGLWLLALCAGTLAARAWHTAGGDEPPADPFEGMVLIPGGDFLMGSTEADEQAKGDERPQRVVHVPAFYIDQFEITQIEYKRFIDATGYPPPPSWQEGKYAEEADFYPIVEVSWWDAMAYARWAGKRLPTEAEWEKAARGTDGRRYPWGNDYDSHLANTGRYFVPVNAHLEGASPYGVVNMAGNASEWTASVYEQYPDLVAVLPAEFGGVDASGRISRQRLRLDRLEEPKVEKLEPRETRPPQTEEELWLAREDSLESANDPRLQYLSAEELKDDRPRVTRGGSINTYPLYLRCANRGSEGPSARWYNLGFRCAKDAAPEAPATPAEH